jgi:hypothetical protein
VTLCSEKGATTDEIVRMIDEAAAKIEATTSIPEDRRTALIQQMRAKIAELQGQLPVAEPAAPAPIAVADVPPASAVAETAAGPAATAAPSAAPPVSPRPAERATGSLSKPKLSFSCISPEYPAGGPCVTLSRDTIVTLRSGEPVPSGFALRFVRQGDAKAEIALGALRKGQSLRLAIPQQVCSGVVSAEVEMDVVGGGRVLDRQGPYLLHC